MDKIYHFGQKVVLAAALIAAVGSLGAPHGALAASAFDSTIKLTDMNMQARCGATACNGATQSLAANTAGLRTNIYSTYQTMMQASTDSTCIAASSFWNTNNNNADYFSVISKPNKSYQAGITSVPANDQGWDIIWAFGVDNDAAVQFDNNLPSSGIQTARVINANTPAYTIRYQWQFYDPAGAAPLDWYQTVSCTYSATSIPTNGLQGAYVGNQNSNAPYQANGDGGHVYESVEVRGLTFNYPVGYVGVTPPTSYVPPNYNSTVPNIVLRGVNNWEGQFSDDNFLTIDAVPFTCVGGLSPVIRGELWDDAGTPVLMDTFEANATGLFTIKFPKDTSDHDYRIVTWYDCDDGTTVFTDAAHYSFTITGYGQLKNESLFEQCIDADFPFLHPEACLNNMFQIINLMHFGSANFGGDWNSPNGCYTLVYIDDWINRPGQQVCPAVKGTVRTLMTPVVLFLLALAMVRIINRHNERRP